MAKDKEKIRLIIDTTVFGKKRELPKDYLGSSLTNIVEFINKSKLQEKVLIFIPELVQRELVSHMAERTAQIKSSLGSIKNELSNCYEGIQVSHGLDAYDEESIAKLVTQSLNKSNIGIIKTSGTSAIKLVDRWFSGTKPFGSKESEKGFKDTLIWLSILNFAKDLDTDERVIFLTGNINDYTAETADEFKKQIGMNIDIVGSETEVKELLDKICKLKLNYQKVKKDSIELLNKPSELEKIKNSIMSFGEKKTNTLSAILGRESFSKSVLAYGERFLRVDISKFNETDIENLDIDNNKTALTIIAKCKAVVFREDNQINSFQILGSVPASAYNSGLSDTINSGVYTKDVSVTLGVEIDFNSKDIQVLSVTPRPFIFTGLNNKLYV